MVWKERIKKNLPADVLPVGELPKKKFGFVIPFFTHNAIKETKFEEKEEKNSQTTFHSSISCKPVCLLKNFESQVP